ncbi:hypothetical protein [Novipirellula rosea]|uniref:CAAX amino terminal protease self-immunity n=1 Tax=Novipirellula rosea TaxID=1031540 RepID=A0ABP8N2M2_9BACT
MPKLRIFDLLVAIAMLALHFAQYRMLSLGTDAEIAGLLNLTPTLIVAWVLFRSRTSIPLATLLHYCVSLVWVFVNTYAREIALNARTGMNSSRFQTIPLSCAIDDMLDMTTWSIAFSATFAIVCYAAISNPRPATLPKD